LSGDNRAIWKGMTTLNNNNNNLTLKSFQLNQMRLMGTKVSASDLKKGDYVEYKGM